MSFVDLKKDMQVFVEYEKEGEEMIATIIKVVAPKGAPKKEEPAEAPKKQWAIHLKQERHTRGGVPFFFSCLYRSSWKDTRNDPSKVSHRLIFQGDTHSPPKMHTRFRPPFFAS